MARVFDDDRFMEHIRAEYSRHVTNSNYYCYRSTSGHIVEAWKRDDKDGLWHDVTEIEQIRERLQELQDKLDGKYGDVTLSKTDKLNLGVYRNEQTEGQQS